MVFVIYQHESTIGIHEPPPSQTTPPQPTPSGLHRVPALGSLHHTISSHWLSNLHMKLWDSVGEGDDLTENTI